MRYAQLIFGQKRFGVGQCRAPVDRRQRVREAVDLATKSPA